MQLLKKIILKYLPNFIVLWAKKIKKIVVRKKIAQKQKQGNIISQNNLVDDLREIGLKEADSVLIHSSLSKIGFVDGGAKTLVDSLFEVVGKNGNLLFPSFPAEGRNKDYLEQNSVFDINKTPSKMGCVSEYFRTLESTLRSFHPTDSVCAIGPLADYFTNSHFGELTPYTENSPFRKLCLQNGKILLIGVTLNSCTNLHTLEDAIDFIYPVYDKKIYEVKMIDKSGNETIMKTKVHNPEYSKKRKCDDLKSLFEKENVLINGLIGEANCMLIDAKKMHEVMLKYYIDFGVTMYTPYGTRGTNLV